MRKDEYKTNRKHITCHSRTIEHEKNPGELKGGSVTESALSLPQKVVYEKALNSRCKTKKKITIFSTAVFVRYRGRLANDRLVNIR